MSIHLEINFNESDGPWSHTVIFQYEVHLYGCPKVVYKTQKVTLNRRRLEAVNEGKSDKVMVAGILIR